MTTHAKEEDKSSNSGAFLATFLVVAALYFMRDVFIPLALAALMAFLLVPLASLLERTKIGRVASSATAVILALCVLSGVFYCVWRQFEAFGKELPKYEESVHKKLKEIGTGGGSIFNKAAKSIEDFGKDLTPPAPSTVTNALQGKRGVTNAPPEPKPVPVVVENKESTLQIVKNILGPSLNIAVTVFLVTVFCLFILIERDDLRRRVVCVAGRSNARMTNQLMRETGGRISRYLFMQLIVNVTYGVPIGLGLWAIGIPHPLLWGMMATLLRYIPYAGPWIAAFVPFLIAFAIGEGANKPLLVLGLFGVVEIVTANFIEPWLYGSTTGITPLAVLLAAVFWTWLWGPIGLLLSMPLTVSFVSIARYAPQLEWLDKLFGEDDANKAAMP